jgi:sec-independent protein translocase protein TatA
MLENIGPTELLVILLVALLIFGPKKLPELGKGIGQSIREFKKAMRSIDEPEKEAESQPKENPSA